MNTKGLFRIECESIRSMDPVRMGTAAPSLGIDVHMTLVQRRNALSELLSGLSPEQTLALLAQADSELVEHLRQEVRKELQTEEAC